MIIGIASDHGGFELKKILKEKLSSQEFNVIDYGNSVNEPGDDYPDYVIPLARAVASGEAERGIAICGSGVGASIAANKIPGIRAALVHDHFTAHQGVEDDNMNIICFGGRTIGEETATEILFAFLKARFSNLERHDRRLKKLEMLENNPFA
ncbi:MAG: RpiB/LacA/LacB family sugar-phosphate isomerase [Bacteroidales bacterium]|nr:RpiB/LacA/LacB family sugar-phosphate isomerase [Bacteroidales bacterium]MDT8374263.1 RpiB/LacA/LacB family sugar-phosphate isomerase [Bacteroidales bacterium]